MLVLMTPKRRGNQLSYSAMYLRWGRDSNPRYDRSYDSLAVSWLRPLIHLTINIFDTTKKSCGDGIYNYCWISRTKVYISKQVIEIQRKFESSENLSWYRNYADDFWHRKYKRKWSNLCFQKQSADKQILLIRRKQWQMK